MALFSKMEIPGPGPTRQPGETEKTRHISKLLDDIRVQVRSLHEHSYIEPKEKRNEEIALTHERLNDLHLDIDQASQDLGTLSVDEDLYVEEKAREVHEDLSQPQFSDTTPLWVQQLLGGMSENAAHLAEKKRKDPGAFFASMENGASVLGGRVASGAIGGTIGTAVATAIPSIGLFGPMAGTVAGAVGVPALTDYVAEKISKNPKVQAAIKIATYGTLAAGAIVFLPEMLTTLGITAGIAGVFNIAGYFGRKIAEKRAAAAAEQRAAERRAIKQAREAQRNTQPRARDQQLRREGVGEFQAVTEA